jgi:hypothetical protein
MTKLERLTYVCLITLCILSAGTLAKRWWLKDRTQEQVVSPNMLIGQRIDIPGATWGSSQINVVVFLSGECRFCEASMPFYRRLASEHRHAAGSGVSLLAVSLEPSEYLSDHLASEQLQFDHVFQLKQPSALLHATPTFLIVDKNGVIQRAAIGELPATKEDEMLKIVKTGELSGRI